MKCCCNEAQNRINMLLPIRSLHHPTAKIATKTLNLEEQRNYKILPTSHKHVFFLVVSLFPRHFLHVFRFTFNKKPSHFLWVFREVSEITGLQWRSESSALEGNIFVWSLFPIGSMYRIFYLHLPSIWANMYIAKYSIHGASGNLWIWKKNLSRLDPLSRSPRVHRILGRQRGVGRKIQVQNLSKRCRGVGGTAADPLFFFWLWFKDPFFFGSIVHCSSMFFFFWV